MILTGGFLQQIVFAFFNLYVPFQLITPMLFSVIKLSYLNCIAFTGCIFFTSKVGIMSVAKHTASVITSTSNTCHQII
jgi:hypothetical protein